MKINLLPMESQRLPITHRRTLVMALLCAILLVGAGYAYWHLDREVRDKRDVLSSLQATNDTLRPFTDKVQALDDARRRLQEAEASRSFLVQPVMLSDLLLELGQLTPQDVTIREIGLADGGVVQIKGQGQALTSAAGMLTQIGKSKYLSGAKVSAIRGNGASGFSFDMTCQVGKGAAQP